MGRRPINKLVWIGGGQGLLGKSVRYQKVYVECMHRISICSQVVVRGWVKCGNSWIDHLFSSGRRLAMASQRVKGYSRFWYIIWVWIRIGSLSVCVENLSYIFFGVYSHGLGVDSWMDAQ